MELRIEDLSLGYRDALVLREVSLTVAPGELVTVIGPNGSGKSTLLRGIGRLLKPSAGRVLLDGVDMRTLSARDVARRLALLPQSPDSGLDLTVEELVWRGRHPYRSLLRGATTDDFQAVGWALAAANVAELRHRRLESLSGGERQRAWIALALAQEPQVLLLDEPTAFLDIRHQVDVMELLRRLSGEGMTVVAVLHDLLLAARYADRIVALHEGVVAFDGPPGEVLGGQQLEAVYGTPIRVLVDPEDGVPVPVPRAPALAEPSEPSPERTPSRPRS